jgi:hypothetical protein
LAYTVVGSSVPETITAGESVSWRVRLSAFPADESWVLTYTLVKTGVKISIASTADADAHLVELTAATTGAYTAGTYDWQAHVAKGTERYLVSSGIIQIAPDYATQTSGYDARTHTKKVLDALEAAVEGRASLTQLQQKVGEVQVGHMSLKDQVEMLELYRAKYRKEMVLAGKIKSRRMIKARFRGAS